MLRRFLGFWLLVAMAVCSLGATGCSSTPSARPMALTGDDESSEANRPPEYQHIVRGHRE